MPAISDMTGNKSFLISDQAGKKTATRIHDGAFFEFEMSSCSMHNQIKFIPYSLIIDEND